ncbi:MAG: YHYH protein [Chitinophagaceae bacterium]|nr:YHYH protein [Chitinophagaceae bacterium]
MKMHSFFSLITISTLSLISVSCKKSSSTTTSSSTSTVVGTGVPDVYTKIYGATSITSDGTYITIKVTGAPDHKSVYYASTNSLYEAFSGTTFGGNTFSKNPNSISVQNYTFKIPLNPAKASTSTATPLGPIGVSLNGVPFFNQYAGPSQPLTNEVVSFDQYWGHPAQSGDYHYHVEPLYLTMVKASKSALLGFLLDGFPVYGPTENGATVTNSNLDAYHGHSHATTEYPNGIYHYHITSTDPYINGSGFYGTAGTVSK